VKYGIVAFYYVELKYIPYFTKKQPFYLISLSKKNGYESLACYTNAIVQQLSFFKPCVTKNGQKDQRKSHISTIL
jgi:hypothetical protein